MLRNSLRIGERVVERERAGARLPEQLDHHRHLHRARGVKRLVGIDQQFGAAVERAKRDRDFGAARRDDAAQRRSRSAGGAGCGLRGAAQRAGRGNRASASGALTAGRRTLASVRERAPRLRILRDQRAEIQRHVVGRELRRELRRRPPCSFSASGLTTFSSLIRPFSCAMPRLSRNAAHHRPLPLEVVVHERARRDRVRDASAASTGTSLSSRAGDRARSWPGTSCARRCAADGLDLLLGRLLVGPEEFGRREAALGGHPLPQPRRAKITEILHHPENLIVVPSNCRLTAVP